MKPVVDREALRQRYGPPVAPNCPACGRAMTIARAGADITWHCAPHPTVLVHTPLGDAQVIALLDELEALEGQSPLRLYADLFGTVEELLGSYADGGLIDDDRR